MSARPSVPTNARGSGSESAAKTLGVSPNALGGLQPTEVLSFEALSPALHYLSRADHAKVADAYTHAEALHRNQTRHSGEPYITHPLAVAAVCAQWHMDAQALQAALLHDTLEDCAVDQAELTRRHGKTVTQLVEGLTKLEKLEHLSREENQAESFRKMLLASASDVRVILIKLADRTHNMRTLSGAPKDKWARISQETLDVYAPLANRLGLNQCYRELQALCLRHLKPWRYQTLERALRGARRRRKDLFQHIEDTLTRAFGGAEMPVQLEAREKSIYSIYEKMERKQLKFGGLQDLFGVRVFVPQALDCYRALGVLHQTFQPIPGRFKDFIALPKGNGYQSLHTTVLGPAGVPLEFQLRTQEMHTLAEAGVAAHWQYKQGGKSETAVSTNWLKALIDLPAASGSLEFLDHVKVDLLPDEVFVFSPKGKIYTLPRGACIIDFAYAVHSDVGDRALSGIVNQQDVALRTVLQNGDVVEVITAPVSQPNPTWLSLVQSAKAKSHIRHFLKLQGDQQNSALGHKLLLQALRSVAGAEFKAYANKLDAVQIKAPHSGKASTGLETNLSAKPSSPDRSLERFLYAVGYKTTQALYQDLALGRRNAERMAQRLVAHFDGVVADDTSNPMAGRAGETFGAHGLAAAVLNQTQLSLGAGSQVAAVNAVHALELDGSEGASVAYKTCCHPVPGDALVALMGKGDGLAVHRAGCAAATKALRNAHTQRMAVEWSALPTRLFEARVQVTCKNGKGVLAALAASIASAEAEIHHLDMEGAAKVVGADATEIGFILGVSDDQHLYRVVAGLAKLDVVQQAVRL